MSQLVELAGKQDEFARHGINLAGVSYDSTGVLRKFARENKIGYPLLSDRRTRTIRAFGILNKQYKKGHRWYGIPYPYVFLIGPDGRIKGKFWKPGYRDRPAAQSILEFIKGISEKKAN